MERGHRSKGSVEGAVSPVKYCQYSYHNLDRDVKANKLEVFRENILKTALKPSASLCSLRQTVRIKPQLDNKEN